LPGQAKILSLQEIQSVFKLLDDIRDKTIFALGVYTGLRISEIVSLKKEQVFTEYGVKYQLVVYRLKKRDTVWSEIPITTKLRQILIEYRKSVTEDKRTWVTDSLYLFPSDESDSGHLSRKQAHNILNKTFTALKLEKASTHSMRRTLLTTLSRGGIPLRTIQQISGHSNLGQLQAYLEVDPEDKHKALSSIKY
jgi:integrase/recombinase XerD